MTQREQAVMELVGPAVGSVLGGRIDGEQPRTGGATIEAPADRGERAARSSLRSQIARLERELSAIVAETFPHIAAPRPADSSLPGPCLPSLAELERSRDRLAGRVQELRGLAADRVEHERRAREQLERMKLEPGRYKFVRLPVSDLGQGGCGAWEVRPRFGLIGMLAGWWEVKLSSGCPLST